MLFRTGRAGLLGLVVLVALVAPLQTREETGTPGASSAGATSPALELASVAVTAGLRDVMPSKKKAPGFRGFLTKLRFDGAGQRKALHRTLFWSTNRRNQEI